MNINIDASKLSILSKFSTMVDKALQDTSAKVIRKYSHISILLDKYGNFPTSFCNEFNREFDKIFSDELKKQLRSL